MEKLLFDLTWTIVPNLDNCSFFRCDSARRTARRQIRRQVWHSKRSKHIFVSISDAELRHLMEATAPPISTTLFRVLRCLLPWLSFHVFFLSSCCLLFLPPLLSFLLSLLSSFPSFLVAWLSFWLSFFILSFLTFFLTCKWQTQKKMLANQAENGVVPARRRHNRTIHWFW